MNYDGKLRIATELDNKTIDKDIDRLKGKLDNISQEAKMQLDKVYNISNKVKNVTTSIEETNKKLKNQYSLLKESESLHGKFSSSWIDINNSIDSLKSKKNELMDEYILENKELEKQNLEYNKILDKVNLITSKINKLENKKILNSLESVKNIEYNYNEDIGKGFSLNKKSLGNSVNGLDIENQTDFIANNIKDLKDAFPNLEETDNKLKKIGKSGNKAGHDVSNGFDKGVKKLKNFSLSLFGISTMFSMISKASNAYLSNHSETTQKLQSIWIALGNLIGPIIDRMADGVLKFVGYLNVFVKTLSNGKIDLTKNMNANKESINKTTSALKDLNKELQTYSFDEMNIEQDTSTPSGGIGEMAGNDIPAFKMPELNPKIVETLENMANLLKENWDWISKVGIALGVVFGAKKIGELISNIGRFLGNATGSGLAGLTKVLKVLGTIGAITIGVSLLYTAITGRDLIADLKDIYDYFTKIKEINEGNTKASKKSNEVSKEWQKEKNKEIEAMEKGTEATTLYFNQLKQLTQTNAADNMRMAERIDKMSGMEYWYAQLDGTVDEYNERLKDNFNAMRDSIQSMADMYTQGKLTTEQEKEFFGILSSVNGKLENGKVKFKDMDDRILDASKHTEDYSKVIAATQKEVKKAGDSFAENITKKLLNGKTSISEFLKEFDKTKNLKSNATVSLKTDTSSLTKQLSKLTNVPLIGAAMADVVSRLSSIKLAVGGIVNNPGRGVPLGYNVIGGEAGKEGVLPLTNSGTMQELGYEIGKWVHVTSVSNFYMNSRLLSRETKKASNQYEYLTNGRGSYVN